MSTYSDYMNDISGVNICVANYFNDIKFTTAAEATENYNKCIANLGTVDAPTVNMDDLISTYQKNIVERRRKMDQSLNRHANPTNLHNYNKTVQEQSQEIVAARVIMLFLGCAVIYFTVRHFID